MNLTSDELRATIKNVINETLNEEANSNAFDGREVFNIQKYIVSLQEACKTNPRLTSTLLRFQDKIDKGVKQFNLFETFGVELEEFGKGNLDVKNALMRMNETMQEHGNELKFFKLIESISNEFYYDTILEAYNKFLAKPDDEIRSSNLLEVIQNFYMNCDEQLGGVLLTQFSESANDEYAEYFQTSFLNESEEEKLANKMNEARLEKMSNDIFKKVERYLDERDKADEIKRKHINETYSLNGIANNNGINLEERIGRVLRTDAANNSALKDILMQYSEALRFGMYEERLYETFLHNTSKYDYLLPVDNMRNAIIEAVNDRKEQITLTKILEEMKDSATSYIYVELIQEDVARYVLNPNPTNRVQLRNALMPFASDPYINEMFNIIYTDDSVNSNTVSEKAIALKEQIDIIRQNATITPIYSPVQYVKENESIFNVHGQYYTKKGTNISALDKKNISSLDPRFVELCHLVNDPHVHIYEDHIVLSGSEHYATIYEGYVDIAGYKESAESLRRLSEMCMKYENYDTNFYIMCSCLLENFNNIAKIDWAKRITLNENTAITADIFKLDENIYIATHNDVLMKHTFYRNVNPIFCKNTLNEHMGINVSSLFEDMLPSQHKIILKLNETKNEYENSISQYEQAIEDLNDAKEEATDENVIAELDAAIAEAEQKLEDIKAEYKEWQKDAEKVTNDKSAKKDEMPDVNDEDDPRITREISNEPIDAKEVEDYKDELSTPIGETEDDEEIIDTDNYGGTVLDDEIETVDNAAAPATEDTANMPETEGMTDSEFADLLNTNNAPDEDEEVISTEDAEVADVNNTVEDDEEIDTDNYDKEVFPEVDTTKIAPQEDYSDDNIFEEPEAEETEDDMVAEEPAEESDDEDIIIGDHFDEIDTDVPDMQTVDVAAENNVDSEVEAEESDEEDENIVPATDLFGGDTKDPLGLENEETAEIADLYNPNIQTEDFKIANVMFDENVKTNTYYKSGNAVIFRPMISRDGRKYLSNEVINFYLDENGEPVIGMGAEDVMPTSIHNAIKRAIKEHPSYNTIVSNGAAPINTDNVNAVSVEDEDDNWEEEYDKEMSDEDRGQYTIGGDDDLEYEIDIEDDMPEETETSNFDLTDDEDDDDLVDEIDTDVIDGVAKTDDVAEPVATETAEDDIDVDDEDFGDFAELFADVVDDEEDEEAEETDPVETYTKDGTEIEYPAKNVDDSVIPESKQKNFNKSSKVNESKRSIISIKGKK